MNSVLAKLWLWFWHLLPANPILVRVVSGASRRPRHLYLRAVYLLILLGVVLAVLFDSVLGKGASLTELAKGASQTFMWASIAQLFLMCFLAPVFTASAITQEKDAQTFNILLSTPLTNAQIVLGSLMSRLYFVLVLLIAGLPIFLMTMVYGGVTSRQIVESFALAGSTAILTGALAIFIAMIGVGTRRTIFSFYLLIALYLLAVYMLGRWDRTWVEASPANIQGMKMSWLTPFHPFLALEVALNRIYAPSAARLGECGSLTRAALTNPSAIYLAWTTLLAVVLIASSVLFVRRGAKTGEATFFSTFTDKFRRTPKGERTRTPRKVWANPVAWREAKTRVLGSGPLRWAIIAGGLTASVIILVEYARGRVVTTDVSTWLAGLTTVQFAIALLIATNTAATSMTKEKESKTMDLLLTTPLTSKYILWGKLRGLVSFAAPLLVGPILILLVFALFDSFRGASRPAIWIETAIELAMLMTVYTALACVIGLRFSLHSRTNMVSVMYSVGTITLVFGLLSVIGFSLVGAFDGEVGAFFAPLTPFTSIWFLVNPVALFDHSVRDLAAGAAAARTVALFGVLVAVGLCTFIVWRAYAGLVRDFDMTIRKQSGH